nr:recombinase family protein [Pseudomonas aeruginosa]
MRQRIGYARVSTEELHLDLQRDALQQAGCHVIYEEAVSGKSASRA